MNNAGTCPECGAKLPPDAPQGICPKCLLARTLDTDADGTPSASPFRDFVPPSVEDLAKHFPKLEILEFIGRGGMGAVYKARQKDLDRLVALKILPLAAGRDPGFAERFAREARALAKLHHSNIVTVFEYGKESDYYYFVMEWVDGITLREKIGAGPLQPVDALAIIPQICEALQYAHDEGIIHRDIKPDNILIDQKGRAKIADFGIAKLRDRSPGEVTLTDAQHALGTLDYMAPEQRERDSQIDHRADIYSLGVVFYEMLTGKPPTRGRCASPSQKVPVDPRVDEVVFRALDESPERRYQQAQEIKMDIDNIAAAKTTRRRVLVGTVSGIVMLFVVATWIQDRVGRRREATLRTGSEHTTTALNALTNKDGTASNYSHAITGVAPNAAQVSRPFNTQDGPKPRRDQFEPTTRIRQKFLADQYYFGLGVRENHKEAANWYRKAAEQGLPEAQYMLATCYALGHGVPQDDKESFQWLRQAADQGHLEALVIIGHNYEYGIGVERNYQEAFKCYETAAMLGDADGQFAAASCYKEGKGTTRDSKQMIKLLRQASEQSHAEAQFMLASLYESGATLPEDHKEAAKWYRKAAEQGHERAAEALRRLDAQ